MKKWRQRWTKLIRINTNQYELVNNVTYGKTVENLENRIDVRLLDKGKDQLKSTSNQAKMLHKIFDNNLVAMRSSKVELKLNKPAFIRRVYFGIE